MPLAVEGYRELMQALAHADRQTDIEVRKALRESAEPVRRSAEGLAIQQIPRIGPRWPRMRTGMTRSYVYVAPREKGVRNRQDPKARPNLAGLLMDRAMEPALERHAAQIEQRVEHALDVVADEFNEGGPHSGIPASAL